ncbi:MAG: Ig-like domain-containing protein [Planctomycetota bacterium]|nr:Ig-like domain-containing protein [Planctomycetota bacterium]
MLLSVLVNYNFTGQPGDQLFTGPAYVDSNITATNIPGNRGGCVTRGPGVLPNAPLTPAPGGDSISSRGWPTGPVDKNYYYSFGTWTPKSGYSMTLTSLRYSFSGGATFIYSLANSLDNFTVDSVDELINKYNGGAVSINEDFTKIERFANLTKPIEFRLYAYEIGLSTADVRLKNNTETNPNGLVLEGTVQPVTPNHAPIGTAKTVTMLEDTAYPFAASDFGFSDPNDTPSNNFLAAKVTTTPAAGSLTDNGATVTVGQFISVSDINSGKLAFTPAANANGSPHASFTFQVQDDGGTANGGLDIDPTPRTMTINVTSVNDAPSFAKGANQTVNASAGAQTLANWATAISAGPTDESSQALSFLVSNDNNGLFSVQPTISANGTLTYTPAANANGLTTVTVRLRDGGARPTAVWTPRRRRRSPSPCRATVFGRIRSHGLTFFET